jgi:hypothetical protein
MYLQNQTNLKRNIQSSDVSAAQPKKSDISLAQNYPNPFKDSTIIRYSLTQDAEIMITVYDEAGKVIQTIVNAKKSSGMHSVGFESKELQPGKYFYRLTALFLDGTMNVTTKKMQVV